MFRRSEKRAGWVLVFMGGNSNVDPAGYLLRYLTSTKLGFFTNRSPRATPVIPGVFSLIKSVIIVSYTYMHQKFRKVIFEPHRVGQDGVSAPRPD